MDEKQVKPITWNEIFRESRDAAGLSQAAVSEAAGITQARYSRFETGGSAELSPSEMQKIQMFLDRHPVKRTLPNLHQLGAGDSAFGRYATLAELLKPFYPSIPEGGKLTEHIAKHLEEQRERAEKARLERESKRQHEQELKYLNELADLLGLPDDPDVRQSTSALLEGAKALVTKCEVLESAFDAELKEKLDLQEQLAKLQRKFRKKGSR